ncbi:hypothetical protein HHL11_22060 [Ramlibacter sp. G-1-2-2]|uniref:Uncharacterized protein n=1 Tax=Ramlibacter agri TaxID=2728837 RepID=A0A848H665_9BURK|nr:hypothetical protein [Ramlibacter agri]NML46446.1 hypothetical protein [Ramlibacter agri]
MDYRDTEDFARLKEAAALRARQLRGDAIDAMWNAIGRALRRVWTALRRERQITLEA